MKIVISAFPGCGKTHFYNSNKDTGYKGFLIHDSDSSAFEKSRFPQNYIDHIKNLIDDEMDRIILVSSHDVVRKALTEAGIKHTVVVPNYDCFGEYIHRYRERGNDTQFITMMVNNFDKFIDSCIIDSDNGDVVILDSNTYLSDYIEGRLNER